MKKLLVLSVLFTLLSCSTGSNNSVNSTSNDSINVDTTVVDTNMIKYGYCLPIQSFLVQHH